MLNHKGRRTRKVGCISTSVTITLVVTYWHKIRGWWWKKRDFYFQSDRASLFSDAQSGGLMFCKKQFQHHKALFCACRFKGKMWLARIKSVAQPWLISMCLMAPVLEIGSVTFQNTLWPRDHLQQGDMGQAIFLFTMEEKNNENMELKVPIKCILVWTLCSLSRPRKPWWVNSVKPTKHKNRLVIAIQ